MERGNKQQKALETLEALEKSYQSINSKFWREMEIWEEIAMQLNSNLSKSQQKHWCLVMDLYNKKYRNDARK